MELLFKALADRTRLRLLNLIAEDEICVCFFVEALRPINQKFGGMAYLRKAGVVAGRREGKWIHYRSSSLPMNTLPIFFEKYVIGCATMKQCNSIELASHRFVVRHSSRYNYKRRRALLVTALNFQEEQNGHRY